MTAHAAPEAPDLMAALRASFVRPATPKGPPVTAADHIREELAEYADVYGMSTVDVERLVVALDDIVADEVAAALYETERR